MNCLIQRLQDEQRAKGQECTEIQSALGQRRSAGIQARRFAATVQRKKQGDRREGLIAIYCSDCCGATLNIQDGESAAYFFCADFYIRWLGVNGVTILNRTWQIGADRQPFHVTPEHYEF